MLEEKYFLLGCDCKVPKEVRGYDIERVNYRMKGNYKEKIICIKKLQNMTK